MNKENTKLYQTITLCLFLFSLILLCQIGCSGDSVTNTIYVSASPTPADQAILNEYFSPEMVARMRSDAQPLIDKYGVNVFSTAQYGNCFYTGTVNIKDVFDARNSTNYSIFIKYAQDNNLILNPTPSDGSAYYTRYSMAATKFLQDFEYDVVLFRPDEYHPVFTKSTDSWIFVRDDPNQRFYYSSRVDNRQPAIEGGMLMQPLNMANLWMYYIPKPESPKYTSYQAMDYAPYQGSTGATNMSPYKPVTASQEIIDKRAKLGIIPSSLSNRNNVPVGTWKSKDYLDSIWKIGFSFGGDPKTMTWGGLGLYLLPLDKEFWK